MLRWAEILVRVVLGAIFAYAGYLKAKDPWALFAMNIDSYQVLPLWAVRVVAQTLPWMEIAIGVLMITGIFRRVATTATTLLLGVFFCLMVRAYAKGMEINCGCFGPGDIISWKTLLRDGSLLAAAIFVTVMSFLPRNRKDAAVAGLPEPAYRA